MAIQTIKVGQAVNDGTGDDARTTFIKINQNFTDSANAASRLVGTGAGNVMEVGAFGIGDAASSNRPPKIFGFYKGSGAGYTAPSGVILRNDMRYGIAICATRSGIASTLFFGIGNISLLEIDIATDTVVRQAVVYTDLNTTKDGNGFIKAASPIIKLFADTIELNDEAQLQDVTFEKLGVGDYLIKGSTGFAQEGWYIEMPKDANGNVLVAAAYEQLENNDISVKTYDYMLNKKGRIVPDLETPLDIPSTRWIDLRLQDLPQSDIEPFATEENTVATNAE